MNTRNTTQLGTPYERMLAGIDDSIRPVFDEPGSTAATTGEKATDSAIAMDTGLIGGVKMLTDVFRADSRASQALGEAQKNLDAKT